MSESTLSCFLHIESGILDISGSDFTSDVDLSFVGFHGEGYHVNELVWSSWWVKTCLIALRTGCRAGSRSHMSHLHPPILRCKAHGDSVACIDQETQLNRDHCPHKSLGVFYSHLISYLPTSWTAYCHHHPERLWRNESHESKHQHFSKDIHLRDLTSTTKCSVMS